MLNEYGETKLKIEGKERRLVITEAQQKIKEEEFRNTLMSLLSVLFY